jgi:hypothetical protein
MNIQNGNLWKAELERLLDATPARAPGDLIKDVCRLGDTMGEDTAGALLEAYPSLFKYSQLLTDANYQRVFLSDTAETRRLMQAAQDGPVRFGEITSKSALVPYNRVNDMFNNVDFRGCRRFVMVGCGRYPSTILRVHDMTDIPEIIGLDIVPEAVDMVRDLARHFHLRRVHAEVSDGCAFDFADAQIVFVANMVTPKSGVVSSIAETAPREVQVVVREPYSLGKLWSDAIAGDHDPRFEIVGSGSGHWSLSRDLYLRRREFG